MKVCPSCQASYQADFTHCPRDGAALSEIGAWHDGTLVRGKYRILGKVGEGGMAVVYKAMHVRFEELRALKVMNEELARDRAFVKRFMHEAVLTRKLQHASAVRVDDIDEAEDGRPFIVMEFVEGRTLKEVIQAEAPMSAARVCPLIRQIAGALDAAHRLGIVHRDVKPANVVLLPVTAAGESERAKLLDFGIAKAREGQLDTATRGTTLTGTGHVIGTPAYMSPEQAKGLRGDQIDGRSDVYSLGIVMYEMLLGALPFKADTSVQWILAHLQTPPRPLWEARPELQIPYAVAGVVMRCLEKDPQNRPPHAAALISEIEWAEHAAGFAPDNSVPAEFYGAPEVGAPMRGQYSAPDLVASPPSRITGRTATQRRDEFVLEPKPRSRIGWIVGVVACLFVAGGIGVWKFWPQLAPAASGHTNAPVGPTDTNTRSNSPTGQATTSPGAMSATNAVESPHTDNTPVDSSSESTSQQGNSVGDKTSTETTLPNRGSERTGQAAEVLRKTPSAKREPKAVPRGTGFGEALLRARDDENQGKFEDALREYEQASALDPSNSALKQHIKHLREQVEKENELIH